MQTWNQTIQLTYINALGLCLNFVFHPCTDIKISIWGVYELNSEHPQAIYVTRVAIGMHFGNPKSSPRGGRCSAAKIWINPFTEVWNRPTQNTHMGKSLKMLDCASENNTSSLLVYFSLRARRNMPSYFSGLKKCISGFVPRLPIFMKRFLKHAGEKGLGGVLQTGSIPL